jgi:PST family polysaccharide transporter
MYEFIFPIWFFQGIEKMKYITWLTLMSRLLFLFLIFILVKSDQHYLRVPIVNGIGAIISGSIGLFIVFYKYKIKFRIVKWKTLVLYLRSSSYFFSSRFSEVIVERTGIVLLGAGNLLSEVAYYDLALKISKTLTLPFNILVNTIYPNVVKNLNKAFILKILKYATIGSFLVYFGVLVLGDYLVQVLGGHEMRSSKTILNILAITIPLSTITYILGDTILIPWGFSRLFNLSTIYRMLLFGILISWLFFSGFISGFSIALIINISLIFDILFRATVIQKNKIFTK